MKRLKRALKLFSLGLLSLFISSKVKSSPRSVEKRITAVRKTIKAKIKDPKSSKITIDFKSYTNDQTWVNWGNWGNWNNWSNWDNWNNWAKWTDWSNWGKFSNF
jgi:hypothetical protein